MHLPQRRMSPRLRAATVWLSLALWLTGAAWMVLHYFFERQGEFGTLPHPMEPLLVEGHGIIAVGMLFLLGWIGSSHVASAWMRPRLRPSGVTLSCCCLLLIVSGFALFYLSSDWWHAATATLHELLGLGSLVVAIVHWRPSAPG
jgi:hypothetical protein